MLKSDVYEPMGLGHNRAVETSNIKKAIKVREGEEEGKADVFTY